MVTSSNENAQNKAGTMGTFEITIRKTHYIATRGNDNQLVALGELSKFVQEQQKNGYHVKMAD